MERKLYGNPYIERRSWQWIDWAFFGIFTSWLAMGFLFIGANTALGSMLERFYCMLGLLGCYIALLTVWRPGYTHKGLLPIVVLFTTGTLEMYLTYKNGEEIVNVVTVVMLILGFHAKGKLTFFFNILVFILALPIIQDQYILDRSFDFARIVNLNVNYASLYAIGYGIQRLWASNYGMKKLFEENLRQYQLIQEQNKILEQYANQVEKLTLLEERNRMARELHDTVGHTFTSVIMGMDAVSYLMDLAPDKAKEKLEVLRNVTRNGLEEVRRSIHEIAPQEEDGTFQQQLSRLAHEFSVHTGTQVKLDQTGEECELPKQAQLTMIRCLQESLTNAKRHGHATSVTIKLRYFPDRVTLDVEDDGIGSECVEAGFGLTAMRERLSALQGMLVITSTPGSGTKVTCTVPLRRQHH